MLQEMVKLAGMTPIPYLEGYHIVKYTHPDNPNPNEVLQTVDTLEEAQAICSAPESSYKEGPTSTWYFIGYVPANSRTKHIQIWNCFD